MHVEITPHIADCLYTGLSTDTGCFKFSSTKARTHIPAAKLMEAGAHVEELNTLLFDTKSRERMEAERIARADYVIRSGDEEPVLPKILELHGIFCRLR